MRAIDKSYCRFRAKELVFQASLDLRLFRGLKFALHHGIMNQVRWVRNHRFSFRDSCIMVQEAVLDPPISQVQLKNQLPQSSRRGRPCPSGQGGSPPDRGPGFNAPARPSRTPAFRPGSLLLIFLHGRFSCEDLWSPIVGQLLTEGRCLIVDLPGYGHSFVVRDRAFSLFENAQMVQAIIQRFSINGDSVVLIGHDIGGTVAQICALARVEEELGAGVGSKSVIKPAIHKKHRIGALVLLNSASLLHQSNLGIHPFTGGRNWNWLKSGWVRWKLTRIFAHSPDLKKKHREALLQPWFQPIFRNSLLRAFETLDESWPWLYERQSWLKAIQGIQQPTLLLWGRNDPLNPPEIGEDLIRRLPDANLFIHDRAGHWPGLEQPEWVLAKTKEFLMKRLRSRAQSLSVG